MVTIYGCMVTIYGCMVTKWRHADELFWVHHWSHLKCMRGKTGWTLDIRICNETSLSYYVDSGLVGSIINYFQG